MKRLLLALVPWMAMTSAARAQAPADVVFTHRGVVDEHCVRVDDECYVPFHFLDLIGWSYSRKGDKLEINAEDQHVRVSVRDVSDTPMIPLRNALERLGSDSSWDGDRLIVLAGLTRVQIKKGHFSIESNMSVKPTIFTMEDPKRVVVDLQGAKLLKKTEVDLDGTSRIKQFKPDTVRVVLETDYDPQLAARKFEPGKSFDFDVSDSTPNDAKKTNRGNEDEEGKPDPKQTQSGNQQSGPPLTEPPRHGYDPASDPDMPQPVQAGYSASPMVGPLTVDSEGDRITAMTLKVAGGKLAMPGFRRPEANVIEIVFPGGRRAEGADFSLAKGPTVRDVDVRDENGNLVVALTLARPMGLEFSLSGSNLQIQLLKPNVGNGHLAGKVIVIDPGHGGHDQGTQSAGLSEKDFTLSIGKLVSQQLANEGATVIMTRKTDVFIPLSERPSIANRNGADFFISVHINSNELDNSASGTITFFHARDPICQVMADCIQREIVKVNGIGGMGVWSDQKIYRTGFAVLRGAKMPAVLIECGFLNTKKDRARMMTDDFQNGIATAVVKGLKAYLGDEGKKK